LRQSSSTGMRSATTTRRSPVSCIRPPLLCTLLVATRRHAVRPLPQRRHRYAQYARGHLFAPRQREFPSPTSSSQVQQPPVRGAHHTRHPAPQGEEHKSTASRHRDIRTRFRQLCQRARHSSPTHRCMELNARPEEALPGTPGDAPQLREGACDGHRPPRARTASVARVGDCVGGRHARVRGRPDSCGSVRTTGRDVNRNPIAPCVGWTGLTDAAHM
jgi:hypothetical protein